MTYRSIKNGVVLIEKTAPLLAFREIVLYRTPVRRRKQFHEIYRRFSPSAQGVDFIHTLRRPFEKRGVWILFFFPATTVAAFAVWAADAFAATPFFLANIAGGKCNNCN